MKIDSLKELYSSKTDEELLSLAAERESLVEGALAVLVEELRRRNLSDLPESRPAANLAETDSRSDVGISADGRHPLMWVGLFLLNTFVVYGCSMQLSPILVGRWFAWVAPALNIPHSIPPADWYLQHLEAVTIIPAPIAGYIDLVRILPAIVGKQIGESRSGATGVWVWTIPTAVLVYRMLTFHATSSVFSGVSMSAFKYFFDIQPVMPTFTNPLVSDPIRVVAQISVTAPFYAGAAYSLGALAWKHRLLSIFSKHEQQL